MTSKVVDESDNEESEDEFLKKLDKRGERKGKVDLDKLTKRQRMAYLQKQNNTVNKQQAVSLDRTLNIASILNNADENVFYELSNAKPAYPKKGRHEEDIDEDEEDMHRGSKGGKDELKRQQLEKILED